LTLHQLAQFPNLSFSDEGLKFITTQDAKTSQKILDRLTYLNLHGANKEYLGSDLDYLREPEFKGIKELKGKASSKREWRLLFIKTSSGERPAKYAVLYGFFKKDEQITKKDKRIAKSIAEREGVF